MRKTMALITVAATVTLLAGCSDDDSTPAADPHKDSIAEDGHRADQEDLDFDIPEDEELFADLHGGANPPTLTLLTWGSSSCPAVPTHIAWAESKTLALTVQDDYGEKACTQDMTPWVSTVELPPSQDGNYVSEVIVNGEKIDFTINGEDPEEANKDSEDEDDSGDDDESSDEESEDSKEA